MHTSPRQAADWSTLFRSTAGSPPPAPVSGSPEERQTFALGFSDERGHRRSMDRPLIARLLGVAPGERPAPERLREEVLLWWAVHDPSLNPWNAITPSGPLLGTDMELGIEAWTESEFAALHALSWIVTDARRDKDPRLIERLRSAALWHLTETQPDNGTNHPWAIHLFADLAGSELDAQLYVETMVHSCLVGRGSPDRLSAIILYDAAEWLDQRGD